MILHRILNSAASAAGRNPLLTSSIRVSHQLAIQGEQWARGRYRQPRAHFHVGGRGPALLLINGFGASGLLWPTALVTELERRYQVIRMDNRGTGWSRRTHGPFTVAMMADDAYEAMRACGHASAVVAGYSMGGIVAQELAVRHPEAVDKMVLMATIPPPPAQVPPGDVVSLLRLGLGPFDDDREFDRDYRLAVADAILAVASPHFTADDELKDEIGAQVLRRVTTRGGALQQSRAILAWHDPRRLTAVGAPTVVFSGQDDPIVPVENGRRIVELIRGATHVELPRTGHLVPWEARPRLVEAL